MLLQVQTRFVSFSYSCLVGDMLLHPGPCLLQSTGTLSGDQAAKLMSAPQPPFHPNHQDHHQHTSRHSVDLHTHRCHISKPQHHCTEQKNLKLLLFEKNLLGVVLGLSTVAFAGGGQRQVEHLPADPHLQVSFKPVHS